LLLHFHLFPSLLNLQVLSFLTSERAYHVAGILRIAWQIDLTFTTYPPFEEGEEGREEKRNRDERCG